MLAMEMGTGKTKVAIDFACITAARERYNIRVLVVCPLSVIGVWESEIEKHAPAGPFPPRWKIVNYDQIWDPDRLKDLMHRDFHVVIADEGHRIKRSSARRSKAMHRLGAVVPHRLLLTGTPIVKNPLDLFSEFKFIHQGIFGTRWAHFKERYAIWGGFQKHEIKKYVRQKELRRKISPYVVRVRKEDCLDLPARSHEIVPVMLEQSREIYDEMATEAIVELEGSRVEAHNVLVKRLRLQQITGGWLKDDKGRFHRVGTEKRDVYEDLLSDMWESDISKVVTFCHFLKELKDIIEVGKSVGYRVYPFFGKVDRELRDRLVASFQETSTPTIFAAQVETGSEGIDLTAASRAIYYSHSSSFASFRHSCDRLHRIGQTKPVTYYHLVVRGSVDSAVMLSLKTKQRLEDMILKHPQLLKGRIR